MGSKKHELLPDKDFIINIKRLVNIKTELVDDDATLELFAVPDEHTICMSVNPVMMQPVVGESLHAPNTALNFLKCDFCDKQFRLASRLKLHTKIHSNTIKYVEETDKDRLSSGFRKDAAGRHEAIEGLQKWKSDQIHKGVKCNVIETDNNNESQSCKSNAKLTNHKCKFCDKQFATPAHLSRHTAVHTGIRPFKCGKCDKAFKDPSVLKRHLRIHSRVRPYCCEVCKKSFIQNKDLQHHLRSHSGDRPHKCQICNKCFSSASYLIVHKRTHTSVKPYVCPVCNAEFYASGTLARHQRTHSTEKQFKCSVCPKAFTRSTTLKQHIQAHHSDGHN